MVEVADERRGGTQLGEVRIRVRVRARARARVRDRARARARARGSGRSKGRVWVKEAAPTLASSSLEGM